MSAKPTAAQRLNSLEVLFIKLRKIADARRAANQKPAEDAEQYLADCLSALEDCRDAISDTEKATSMLPAHWAPYLFNGDGSGLDAGEAGCIDAWIAQNGLGDPVDCGESYFSHSNDATNLAGDVAEFTWLVAKT